MNEFVDMHVHSKFSIDGMSTMEDYCLIAGKTGTRVICFTEHVDFNSAEKNLSIVKDNRKQNFVVDDYFREINRLRKKYGSLTLLSGIEFSEPSLFPEEFALYSSYPFDCITAGIHHCYNSVFPGAGNLSVSKAIYEYYQIMQKTVELGGFQVLAHLDFPKLFFDKWVIDDDVLDMILSTMIDKNILLEVNTSSLNDSCDEPMPSYSVINRYVQLGGNKIVIGSDAHSSDRLSGHFRDVVPRLPNRIQIGYFRDDGISGTNTKKRERFNEMIDDCEAGKIDKVITKSISRFARNTLDCLKYVRKLKELNIDIYFEKENIHTLEASGELLLTIMASLAQQESQSLSQNVKLGLQFRYQDGKVQINHNHFLGYTKDADGNLIIVEEEAKVVRRIFREYLEGSSFRDIAEGLERDGIKTGGKKSKWHLSTIQGILRNEKYIGDALLQKTITTDFIEKTRIKNDGSLPQYYVKDSQPAIIPKDIFTQVQEEMVRRANLFSGDESKKRRVYSSKYALSSICTCSRCGDIYRRIAWNNRGKHSVVWRCCTRVEHGPSACDAPTIQEEELQMATVKAINMVLKCSDSMQDVLKENIEKVLSEDQTDGKLEALNKVLEAKQHELAQLAKKNVDYSVLAGEVDDLREKKQELLVEKAQMEGFKSRIQELGELLKKDCTALTEYDEDMVRNYIKGIKVFDDRFTVSFKAGIDIDIQR